MAFNFSVQVAEILEDGAIGQAFPLHDEPYIDRFDAWEAADIQAATLSLMPSMKIRGWGGRVHKLKAGQFAMVVVMMRGWCIIGEYRNGADYQPPRKGV